MYFNKRHDLVGHLFQGRYGAELIDSSQYFLEVSRYIHLNPVKAQMVKYPQDYPWSSFNALVSEQINPHITTQKILSYFPEQSKEAYKLYVENK